MSGAPPGGATAVAPSGAQAAPETVTQAVVTGDGTTAGGRAARRWRRSRWAVLVIVALLLVVALLAALRPTTSTIAYAPDNAGADGARAVAQVLEGQGVEVEHVTRVADAVAQAGPGTTLLVTPAPYLLPEQADALAATDGDLVLLGADDHLVRAATDGAVRRGTAAPVPSEPLPPRCSLPVAESAGALRLAPGLRAGDGGADGGQDGGAPGDVALCWTADDGSGGEVAALARASVQATAGTRDVTAVDDPSFVRNDAVLDDGNAALALGLLGTHEKLVWLVQDPLDTSATGDAPGAPAGTTLPPWVGVVGLWALLVVVVTAVWRARRLGPLVAEELPVVVRAAETTRGRGRLYRRARSRGHAAAGLRAATAEQVARRLGVPPSADPTALTDAVSRATGHPPQEVADLLYGPPPTDDDALTRLARRLDTLESEVHRS